MVWSLMGEKDLRKKLKDYGLNTQGDKKTLINRIQRYTLLYNSECDSDNPRAVSDLIRQIEREEKQTLPNQQQQRIMLNKKSDPKVIEEENRKYIEDNRNSFNKLIEAMREREGRNIKPLSVLANRICSDDEDIEMDKCNNRLTGNRTSGNQVNPKILEDTINLSDDDLPSSPVLGISTSASSKPLCNGLSTSSDCDLPSISNCSNSNESFSRTSVKKIHSSRSVPLLADVVEEDDDSCSVSYSPKQFSPEMPFSTSYVDGADDCSSEGSFSLLAQQPDEAVGNLTVPNTSIPIAESQKTDPDFVIGTEDLFDNEDTEEVFVSRRKLKRRQMKSPEASPPRTRRKRNKSKH